MSIVGFIVAGFSLAVGAYYLITKFIGVPYNPGLSKKLLGLMGEHVGRIYEVRRRPKYIVDREIKADSVTKARLVTDCDS